MLLMFSPELELSFDDDDDVNRVIKESNVVIFKIIKNMTNLSLVKGKFFILTLYFSKKEGGKEMNPKKNTCSTNLTLHSLEIWKFLFTIFDDDHVVIN